ncbi:MAG TPA: rod shape-determining protein MreD [Candidatus Binatia bacterium]|nr:rod shape-determining protein MreD [Candidatus Binatia bacterium]
MNERSSRLFIAFTLLVAIVLQLFELPYFLAALRPMWVPLTLAYWAMSLPEPSGLITAWLTGLALDVLLGCTLGEHALALTLLTFLVLQLRGVLSLYPIWQEAFALSLFWLLYTLLLFWIDGSTGHRADPWLQWGPIVSTTLAWPLVVTALNASRRRGRSDPGTL